MTNNQECKKCGLLKSTVYDLAPFGPKCLNEGKHDFDDSPKQEKDASGRILEGLDRLYSPQEGDWEESLRSLWQTTRENQGKYGKVKSLFHQTIQAEREKAFMVGHKVWDGKWEAAKEAERSRIVGIAEGMMIRNQVPESNAYWEHIGFNRAIDSLITRIKE